MALVCRHKACACRGEPYTGDRKYNSLHTHEKMVFVNSGQTQCAPDCTVCFWRSRPERKAGENFPRGNRYAAYDGIFQGGVAAGAQVEKNKAASNAANDPFKAREAELQATMQKLTDQVNRHRTQLAE